MTTLGSVGASKTPVGFVAPRTRNPLAGFLEGMSALADAQANNQTAGDTLAMSEAQLTDARKQKELKLQRAQALVDWTRTQGEIGRAQAELAQQYDPSGAEYAAQADQISEQAIAGFNSRLNPELAPEFAPDVEVFRQTSRTRGAGVQLSMEENNYKYGLAQLQTQAMDAIAQGESYEDWLPRLQTYIDQSPFPPAVTRELADGLNKDLQKLDFILQVKDETTNWQSYTGEVDGMPAGMPGPVAGFLNYLAQIESGGRFNVMYGGREFTDMSDHPNQPAVIPVGPNTGKMSSAAGGFQFIKGTWEEAKAALGLTDFSPASQIRAAWWLAQRDYQVKSGGRDLQTDLMSGDATAIRNVQKTLSTTWEALGVNSESTFQGLFAAVTGSSDVPPAVMEDSFYSQLSYLDRQQLLDSARTQTAQQRAAEAEAAKAAKQVALDEFTEQIRQGLANGTQIAEFSQRHILSMDEQSKLEEEQKKYNSDTYSMEKFLTALNSGKEVLDEDERKGFEVTYLKSGSGHIRNQNSEYVTSLLVPATAKSRVIPNAVVQDLTGMLAGPNPQQAAFALQTMSRLRNAYPGAQALFDQRFGNDVVADVIQYEADSGFMGEADVVQRIRDRNDPAKRPALEVIEKVGEKYVKDNASYFTPTALAEEMGLTLSPNQDPAVLSGLTQHAMTMFSVGMDKYGDGEKAYNFMIARVAGEWGNVTTGGEEYMMRFPPVKSGVPSVNGSYDYLDEYIRRDMDFAPEDRFRIQTDVQTARERSRVMQGGGGAVSYLVEKYDERVQDYLPVIDPETGRQLRSAIELDPVEVGDASLWERGARNVQTGFQEAWAIANIGRGAGPATGRETYEDLQSIYAWAGAQLNADRPTFAKPFALEGATVPDNIAPLLAEYDLGTEKEALQLLQNLSIRDILKFVRAPDVMATAPEMTAPGRTLLGSVPMFADSVYGIQKPADRLETPKFRRDAKVNY